MKTPKLLLLALACAFSLGATAQWQWIDRDGHKVFSDRPPPVDVPDKNILKQPSSSQRGYHPVPVADAASAPAAAASTAAGAGKDKELEEKKAQAEAAEAAKKKAEAEKIAKIKAENCARARQAKAAYDSGRLIATTNAQGERVFLDEAGRAAETKRLEGIIATECAP
jgi:hypothetical protein